MSCVQVGVRQIMGPWALLLASHWIDVPLMFFYLVQLPIYCSTRHGPLVRLGPGPSHPLPWARAGPGRWAGYVSYWGGLYVVIFLRTVNESFCAVWPTDETLHMVPMSTVWVTQCLRPFGGSAYWYWGAKMATAFGIGFFSRSHTYSMNCFLSKQFYAHTGIGVQRWRLLSMWLHGVP
jgi:hypothetical protein